MPPKSEIKGISCEIVTPKNRTFGEFANAFRILPDSGDEFLLDFLLYSEQARSAQVVSRVRVRAPMLAAIRDRLGFALTELKGKQPIDETKFQALFMGKDDERN